MMRGESDTSMNVLQNDPHVEVHSCGQDALHL